MSTTKRIDDRDASVKYAPELYGDRRVWMPFGGPQEYLETTTLCVISKCTAEVEFEGIRIAVVGTIAVKPDLLQTSYSIDGGPLTFYRAPNVTSIQYQHTFFQSQQLSPGRHRLTVTNEDYGGWFFLDYFEVTDGPSANPPSGPSIPPSNPSTPSQPSSNPNPSGQSSDAPRPSAPAVSQPPNSASASNQQPSSLPIGGSDGQNAPQNSSLPVNTEKSSSNTAAIVGGAMGGLLALLVIAFVLWRLKKRKQKHTIDIVSSPMLEAQPFIGGPLPTQANPRRSEQSSHITPYSNGSGTYGGAGVAGLGAGAIARGPGIIPASKVAAMMAENVIPVGTSTSSSGSAYSSSTAPLISHTDAGAGLSGYPNEKVSSFGATTASSTATTTIATGTGRGTAVDNAGVEPYDAPPPEYSQSNM